MYKFLFNRISSPDFSIERTFFSGEDRSGKDDLISALVIGIPANRFNGRLNIIILFTNILIFAQKKK